MNLFRQLLFCLAAGGLITLACGRASGQSCGSSYSRTYSRGTTYSYAAPTYSSYSAYSYSTPVMSYAAPAYVAPAATTYEAPVVKKEVSYLRFLAVLPLVELPSYSAVYTPPPPVQQQQNGAARQAAQAADPQVAAILDQLRGLNEGLTRLDRKVGQIDARLDRLERTPRGPIQQPQQQSPPEPGPQPDKEPAKAQPQQQTKAATGAAAFAAANKASCAACHQRGKDDQGKDVPETYGAGFVFTEADGTLAKLDSKQVLSVQRQLTTGKMPKVDTARARAAGVIAPTQQQADAIFRRLDEYVLTMTE